MCDDKTTVLRPHKNCSSQNWTFQMSGGEMEHARRSTTHETYRRPDPPLKPLDVTERKRKEFEEHLWKTMTEEVLNDLVIKAKSYYAQNNQFETTYNSNFQIKGFKLKEIGEHLDKELCARYPLYNTNGMSVPVNRYEREKAKQSVHKSMTNLFKKDSRFTGRMNDPNDYHAPVTPGHVAFI